MKPKGQWIRVNVLTIKMDDATKGWVGLEEKRSFEVFPDQLKGLEIK